MFLLYWTLYGEKQFPINYVYLLEMLPVVVGKVIRLRREELG